MKKIDERLAGIPRKGHTLLPTPIHELTVLSGQSDCRVFCKRDDLTGFGFGGNKARKLDFLIAEALRDGHDTLVAVGANQSNFCRMVAAYGSVHGLEVHLVLGGNQPDHPTGNLRLAHLLEANCHHLDSHDWPAWEEQADQLAAELVREGRSVYRMPVGGSTVTGTLGYVSAMSEIMDDEERLGLSFDAVVMSTSSASTQAGLVVGKALADWPGRIVGISSAKDAASQKQDVEVLSRATAELLGTNIEAPDILVDDRYLGKGYAARTRSCDEAVEFFARRMGIFLDEVYTGKAAAGLLDYLATGQFKPGSNVLFLHTGGSAQLFA
jgi:1-aminocyclopropane-1-carboxylate deaminase/D-cysteine desulfhydrase-like pyridoxal-dependent ACC family enzyme